MKQLAEVGSVFLSAETLPTVAKQASLATAKVSTLAQLVPHTFGTLYSLRLRTVLHVDPGGYPFVF